jgi:osmotically-inducible protein OsmY
MTVSSGLSRLEHAEWPSDGQLQHQVHQELHSVPGLDPSRVRVSVRSGVVYLDGDIPFNARDADVRKAVFRLHGVVGMIDRLRTASNNTAPNTNPYGTSNSAPM